MFSIYSYCRSLLCYTYSPHKPELNSAALNLKIDKRSSLDKQIEFLTYISVEIIAAHKNRDTNEYVLRENKCICRSNA